MINARQRLSDVKKLRTNILQSFFKLICVDNWQEYVFDYIDKNRKAHSNSYNTIIIKGNSYSIEDMDDTLLMEIFYGCGKCRIKLNDKDLVKMMKDLKVDRNHYSHSNENENDEELYLTGLLDLCRLSMFLERLNAFETSIDDEKRNMLFKKYYPLVNNLKTTMDEERITNVQIEKSIKNDIDKILMSQDKDRTYFHTQQGYFEMYFKSKRQPHIYSLFLLRATEAGLSSSPFEGIDYYFLIKDYKNYVKRLIEIADKLDVITYDYASEICYHINMIDFKYNDKNLRAFIERLKKETFKKDEYNYKIQEHEYRLLTLEKQTSI